MNSNITLQITELTEAQQTTLSEWHVELLKLLAERRASYRTAHRQLCTHLASAVHGAYCAIAEVCAPAKTELVVNALAAVQPYFERPGDARAAAVKFPALAALGVFLRGPDTDLTLNDLTSVAEETAAVIETLLAGEIVWQFAGDEP